MNNKEYNKAWKEVYLEMFYAAPKKQRTNKQFINSIHSSAKLLCAIYNYKY